MQSQKSIVPDKSDGFVKPEQTSADSKGAALRRRINMQMAQNVLLIWLDNNIDGNSANCRNTISQLRCVVNGINTFTDADSCVDFLTDNYNENVCMIISGALCQNVVPLIHDVAQLYTIFVFCENKKEHEQWAKDWFKIQGVYTEISPVCEVLKQVAHQCEQNALSISFVTTGGDNSKKKLDQLDPSFMYTQIMKEILLTINFEPKHFTQFIDYCGDVFADNESELRNVKRLEKNYRDETPIWWYTFQCFLYPMLNRALRLMDTDIIIKLGFFIGDLHRHIEQLHKEQSGSQQTGETFTVYRGQGMSKTEFEQLTEHKGGLISFNNFLSTSKNRSVSDIYTPSGERNPDLIGILFVLTIHHLKSSSAFASIIGISQFQEEDEVLFAMNTVFRICNITPMGENQRLFQVELTLTSDNDKDLRQLTDYIRDETFPDVEGWYRLGSVLLEMGQSDKAEDVYQTLLDQATEEREKVLIYAQLGSIKCNQGEYEEAITFYEKSLEIYQKTLPPNHPNLAHSYNNIAVVYDNMGEYSKAVSSHEKALEIRQQSLPPNHPYLASSYNNIGVVYDAMGEYSKALSSYEKALEIRQQSLPPNHPDLAKSYIAHGLVYDQMGEYPKAIAFYEKALEIQKKSLLPNHPDLARSYNNIGLVHDNVGEYSKALSYYEKALKIQEPSLPANHPDLASSYNNIGMVYRNMGEYSKALLSHEKALEIQKQSLPPNHPDLAMSYNNIGAVYNNADEYSRALPYFEKALEISKQSLRRNHPDLASSYNNIGVVYAQMSDYSKALLSHEKALEIQQQSFPSDHPDLAMSYGHIGNVYSLMGDYSKAFPFCERAVNIAQRALPTNHSHLQWYSNNLDTVKEKL